MGVTDPASTLASALAAGTVVLDGGLATELERAGHDVSTDLWSARVLRDDPEAVLAAHLAFFAAGAQVATTASYQASYEGFAAEGLSRSEAAGLLRRSVELGRAAQRAHADAGPAGQARPPTWVAASIGPYGAMLAGGQEYTGEYAAADRGGGMDVTALARFHRPRLEVLAEAGPDVLALETIPCLAEAEALLGEVERLGVPAWLSLTTVTGPGDLLRTRRGEPAEQAFAMARDVDAVVAVGVNCTDPAGVAGAARLAAAAGGKPVVVYPNSGETWDGPGRIWRGDGRFDVAEVSGWAAAGARLIGGCCRVGPNEIAAIAAILRDAPAA